MKLDFIGLYIKFRGVLDWTRGGRQLTPDAMVRFLKLEADMDAAWAEIPEAERIRMIKGKEV